MSDVSKLKLDHISKGLESCTDDVIVIHLCYLYVYFMISGEKVEVTGVEYRRRSVKFHPNPVVHVPDLAPGHSLVADHVLVQRVVLGLGLSPRADQSLYQDQEVGHGHSQDQRVVHARDQEVYHDPDQKAGHSQNQDPGVGRALGVVQYLGRVPHVPDQGQEVARGMLHHPILGPGSNQYLYHQS
jgi:hypothetical protein